MMNAKIFRLFILSLSLFIASVGYAESPLRGIHLSADAFGYIYPNFVKDKFYSTELSLAVNLKNRFFPVLEAGVGHTNMVSHLYDIGYSTRAPYYRIGMDYNMQYKNGRSNHIYLGARVGYTAFKYSVDAPALIDPVWGDEAPVQFSSVPSRAVWAEAVGGVRAEILKNIYMGWSLRYKFLLNRSAAYGGPWYIPGFGTGKKTVLGATYTIGYYFNLFKKK
jgi:hypothetical protein